jgi:hypothetical protein
MSQSSSNNIEFMANNQDIRLSSNDTMKPFGNNSQASVANIEPSSRSMQDNPSNYEILWSKFINWFTLRRRNLQQFRILLFLVLCINVFAIMAEIIDITYKDDDALNLPNEYAVLSIIAAILAFSNVMLLGILIFRPSSTLALCSCALILFLEIIYIAQIIIFYVESSSNTAILVINIIFIVLQVLTSAILYRYWEYVYYYYDDTRNRSQSNISDISSSIFDIESSIGSNTDNVKLRKTLVE